MAGRGVRCAILLVSGCFAWGAIGCGPKFVTGSVEGTVTHKGKPVTDATILFQGTESSSAEGARLDASGSYKIASLRVGPYVVSVLPADNLPPAGPESRNATLKERPDIPTKYRNGGKSDLKHTVTQGTTKFDVKLD